MGSEQLKLQNKVNREWVQIYRSNKRIIYNKVTEDEFQFITLSKINKECNISQIKERSIYPIPNTPKLILLYDGLEQLSILVQSKTKPLKAIINQIFVVFQLLQILRSIVMTLKSIYCRYGPFRINEKMMCFNKNLRAVLWINENFQRNEVQTVIPTCLSPQQQMLTDAIRIINENCVIKLNTNLFKAPPTTFSVFLAKLDRMINQQRSILHEKQANICSKQIKKVQFQSIFPNKQFHLQHQWIQQQKKTQKGQGEQGKYKVPTFVRNAKFNKIKNNNAGKNNQNSLKTKDKDYIFVRQIKSLNCSPETKQTNIRDSTKNGKNQSSFSSSYGNLGSLLFSKQLNKRKIIKNPENIANNTTLNSPFKKFRTKQVYQSLEYTQIDKCQPDCQDMAHKDQALNSSIPRGQLSSYCKLISKSRELLDLNKSDKITRPYEWQFSKLLL